MNQPVVDRNDEEDESMTKGSRIEGKDDKQKDDMKRDERKDDRKDDKRRESDSRRDDSRRDSGSRDRDGSRHRDGSRDRRDDNRRDDRHNDRRRDDNRRDDRRRDDRRRDDRGGGGGEDRDYRMGDSNPRRSGLGSDENAWEAPVSLRSTPLPSPLTTQQTTMTSSTRKKEKVLYT